MGGAHSGRARCRNMLEWGEGILGAAKGSLYAWARGPRKGAEGWGHLGLALVCQKTELGTAGRGQGGAEALRPGQRDPFHEGK